MALKIVRNDITQMDTEAIVNTANEEPVIGKGCDYAIYTAAGIDELLEYRKENIGHVDEGEVFITPGFELAARYIIHIVSPKYIKDDEKNEKKLYESYMKGLVLAYENGVESIAIPLISSGSYGYPKEEAARIAITAINEFLTKYNMLVYLVVFDEESNAAVKKKYSDIDEYIDNNYVSEKIHEESHFLGAMMHMAQPMGMAESKKHSRSVFGKKEAIADREICMCDELEEAVFDEEHENMLNERMKHLADSFSEYLLYIISSKGMENAQVYKRALVDKKTFSKIKNNVEYHPQKITALCLCVGAQLNLDETKDMLARAGYALSPCDKTDVIFSYFIENQIYDMIEIDIQLEEHGLSCIIA